MDLEDDFERSYLDPSHDEEDNGQGWSESTFSAVVVGDKSPTADRRTAHPGGNHMMTLPGRKQPLQLGRSLSHAMRSERSRHASPLAVDVVEQRLKEVLGKTHTPEELAQVRKLLLSRGPVYSTDLEQLLSQIQPTFFVDWQVFLRTNLLLMAFPIVALAVYRLLTGRSIKYRAEIERGLRLFYAPQPGSTTSVLEPGPVRQLCIHVTTGLLVGYSTMIIALLFGIARAPAWLGAPGNPTQVLDHGNCVETVFPFLIYAYFALQMALGVSVMASQEDEVERDKLDAARHDLEHASFLGEAKVRCEGEE